MLLFMVRGLPGLAAAAASLLACTGGYDRTPLVVQNYGGLLVSNSPMLREQPLPEDVEGALEVRYSLLVDNQGDAPVRLYLSRSLSQVANLKSTVHSECRVRQGALAGDVSLPPLSRTRVDCRLRLTALGLQHLEQGHALLTLAIPAARGERPFAIGFAYYLFEDDTP